jgi:hypothetical protein
LAGLINQNVHFNRFEIKVDFFVNLFIKRFMGIVYTNNGRNPHTFNYMGGGGQAVTWLKLSSHRNAGPLVHTQAFFSTATK